MKSFVLAGITMLTIGTASFADGLFWVVGNRAGNSCDIVGSNPAVGGNIYFADGPYKSMDDAKLARSTIRTCPKLEEVPAK